MKALSQAKSCTQLVVALLDSCRHLPRVYDYLWVAEDGMKMQVGSAASGTVHSKNGFEFKLISNQNPNANLNANLNEISFAFKTITALAAQHAATRSIQEATGPVATASWPPGANTATFPAARHGAFSLAKLRTANIYAVLQHMCKIPTK